MQGRGNDKKSSQFALKLAQPVGASIMSTQTEFLGALRAYSGRARVLKCPKNGGQTALFELRLNWETSWASRFFRPATAV